MLKYVQYIILKENEDESAVEVESGGSTTPLKRRFQKWSKKLKLKDRKREKNKKSSEREDSGESEPDPESTTESTSEEVRTSYTSKKWWRTNTHIA